ncbi:MAG TPA: amino acid adenylation domain-containing protein, partial [Bryobacteraceae bacterium]|nr:amino acid adenylation domain-containing protein [Bryobacteraceae bacterium]
MIQPGNGSACAPEVYGVTALQEALLATAAESLPAGERNIRLLCSVRGEIDSDLARAAFDRLVERHEMLRTFYSRDMSGAWYCVAGASRCDFSAPGWDELNSLSFEDHVDRESGRPFDLENGPLLRVRLYAGAASTASLLICAPFVAADLASLRILMGEFEIVYAALLNGRAPGLAPLRATYFDYVQQARGHSQIGARGAFGPDAHGIPVLDLPFDRRSAAADDSQGEVQFEVPRAITAPLQPLMLSPADARPGVFLAAFAVLLSRYSAGERIPVALPVSDRKPETRNAVGNYSRLRPAILECPARLSFREMADRAGDAMGAPEAQGDAGSNAPAPVCSAWFLWDNGGSALRLCTGASFELVETDCLPLPGLFDLGLRLSQTADTIRGWLVYRRGRFSRSTVERMACQFLQLLISAASRPDSLTAELEMLPDPERQQVLACAAGPRTEFPALCLHELFAQHAERRPDAEAVVFGAERLSYGELDRRSNQVAQFLRSNGLKQQEIVGVCMEPCADWVVALVGILKAGGAYAPIDPKFPAERIDFMIEDTMTRWVITSGTVPMNTGSAATLISMSAPDSAIAQAGAGPVSNISTPDCAAVLIYTSGTTGEPKGAIIPHRSVTRVVREPNYVRITENDRVAQVMSPSFDVCILEVWGALANGAALVGIAKSDLLALRQMSRILQAEQVTFLTVPAAYLSQIGREDPAMLRNLHTVIYGGEPADAASIRNILKAGPPGILVNAYGPTEGCIIAACYRIESLDDEATSIPIGRALTNAVVYLLDSHLRPVPFGVPGEICIGGHIAHGYWRRPELTRDKFIPDFIGGEAGAMLYRTGDVARLRADGVLEFLGRTDEQVKVRGFRIELGAVQIALASHPDVAEAVVIVREDTPGNRRLVAYVKLRRELPNAAEALRRYAMNRMPEYMVPAVIVPVDSIPLNANGKVDKTALTAP